MNLKTVAFILAMMAIACTSTNPDRLTSSEHFSRYSSLAEALRYYPGLMISGTGAMTQVKLRKNVSSVHKEPLFVVNGMPLGNKYQQANQLINMADVTSIKVISDPK